MLFKDLYTISKKNITENSQIQYRISLNKKHKIFKGHFPSQPVLPGVVMLQLCKELLEKHLEMHFFIAETSRVKFLALVDPSEKKDLIVSQTFQKEKNSFNVKNSITFVDGATVFNCNMQLVVH
ncbi:3-hydroxyacyl-ACP dehydratase [Jejudonia soesokkakensis]|uniref:3-hydroxyacyl-ACP dehydratase n=1 Tax=Jejudonia soesokkakensis TaxID=1323432 RepID=A0ABW2MWH3_9FLAO